jgi:large subunit ribosomal protein L6
MSRVGKKKIAIPKEVKVSLSDSLISVKGPKGSLSYHLIDDVLVIIEESSVVVSLRDEESGETRLQGLYRALINNMVIGTSQGFSRKLELIGVGFRAAVQAKVLDLQLGYSHPTKLVIPADLQVTVEKNTVITVSGADKQLVGQFAAEIRAMRPPEPYKGKGIRYEGEYVRKKAGKTGKGK